MLLLEVRECSVFSRLLVCESVDREGPILVFDDVVGELCAERYKLLDDGRERMVGSDKLAIALVVLSRANTANVNNPVRFCFEELVERVD